jgi:hypothetical protein
MGYRGKVKEQAKARRLRAQNRTLADIAKALGVSKSSVSLWVRDVPFTPSLQLRGIRGPHRRPHPAHEAKLRQIEALNREGAERIGKLDERAFLAAGAALYAGEGSKGELSFANSPEMVRFFCTWLRRFFEIDEARLRVRVYLHLGLDLDAVEQFWSELTQVPRSQFRKAYRAAPDPSIRRNKHEYGGVYVRYTCAKTHRQIMGLVRALLSSSSYSGVAQLVEQAPVKCKAAGSSPAPGATIHTSPSSRTILPNDEKSSRP